MQVAQGSSSEHSYAQHSACQNYNFHAVAKPRLRQAITQYLVGRSPLNHDTSDAAGEACGGMDEVPQQQFVIADLGCSHGRNTLDCAEFVVRTLLQSHVVSAAHSAVDIQYLFSDLPANDFNALFRSLEPYLQQSDSWGIGDLHPNFFAAGVPGSFYGRLFPKAYLNLIICMFSLHWLSQVPPDLVDKASPAWNGGHTWISRAEPSEAVAKTYARQSAMDVRRFLRSRVEELASGGVLFLVCVARTSCTSNDQEELNINDCRDCVPFEHTFEFFDYAWKELVDEGLIASEEMDMFNLGAYYFDQRELESAVKDVPELRLLRMESIHDTPLFAEKGDRLQTVEQWLSLIASTRKSAVEAHVGKRRADELFKKLKAICLLQDCFDARLTHTLLVASLQRFYTH